MGNDNNAAGNRNITTGQGIITPNSKAASGGIIVPNGNALYEIAKRKDLTVYSHAKDYFDAIKYEHQCGNISTAITEGRYLCGAAREISADKMGTSSAEARKYWGLWRDMLLFMTHDDFESYLLYMEIDREPEKRFYLPRRRVLRPLVQDLQDLADRVIDFLAISMPPRTGKSTLGIFFMTWLMGQFPDVPNAMSGHSDALTSGFYKEALSLIKGNQYKFDEIFPDVGGVYTSAKNETIDLGESRRFSTLTCRSIEGTLTGAVDVRGLLYVDDIIEDLEEALNPARMEAKYQAYANQLKDRKSDSALELQIGTRWGVNDVIGRLKDLYEDNPRYRFTVVPALDEKGESNFQYDYGVGFSTEYYEDMRKTIEPAEFCAKYMGEPYVREGLLFPEEEMHFYNGVLPDGAPDKIIAACDVAWGAGDSLSMPFVYIYGSEMYLPDVVFNNGDKTVTRPEVVGKMTIHLPHAAKFEANNGGHEYAGIVDNELRKTGIRLNITSETSPSNVRKLSRIYQAAPDIKRIYFLERGKQSPEYAKFFKEVVRFQINGKNPHDDAPDSLAMAMSMLEGTLAKVIVRRDRPF